MRLLSSLLCLLALLSSPLAAFKSAAQDDATGASKTEQDAKARQLFKAGRIAYEEGLFENAVENFRAAYKLSGRTDLLYNLGMAAERVRRDQEALEAFETYLASKPKAENRAYVEQRIEFLRKKLAEQEAAEGEQERRRVAAEQDGKTMEAPAAALAPDPDPSGPSDDDGITSQWWFWTAVGVGAAAMATGILIATSGEEDLITGDVGGTVTTLTVRP